MLRGSPGDNTIATKPIPEGTILWEPSSERITSANITGYMDWLKTEKGLEFNSYDQLWKWSVDEIHAVAEIPRTLNGKKLEVPVKRILAGIPVDEAVNLDAMSNPDSLGYFIRLADKTKEKES